MHHHRIAIGSHIARKKSKNIFFRIHNDISCYEKEMLVRSPKGLNMNNTGCSPVE